MTKQINWNCSKTEIDLITKIMLRAASLMSFESRGLTRLDISMDLTACHLNGCPLDLLSLLNAEPFDLIHDVAGISRHIDRATGELRDCFAPRYEAKVAAQLCSAPSSVRSRTACSRGSRSSPRST